MSDGKRRSLAQEILLWWQRNIEADIGPARALAAKLRRAGVGEALCQREVIQLYDYVAEADPWLGRQLRNDPAPLGAMARVLAHIRQHDGKSLAWRLGGEEPAMSPGRFERLMTIGGNSEDLALAIVRALPMANRQCAVGRLGRDLLRWGAEKTRSDWYFEYFHTAPPASTTAPIVSNGEQA